VLHRHGFARDDDEHAGRAIFLISDLARIYEGTQDHPSGPAIKPAPVPQTAPVPPGQDSRDAVIVPASELKTVLAALDIAADCKRHRAEMCTDHPRQDTRRTRNPPPSRRYPVPAQRPGHVRAGGDVLVSPHNSRRNGIPVRSKGAA
jgi:hypothetical protein